MDGLEPWNMFTNDLVADVSHDVFGNDDMRNSSAPMESSYLRQQLSKKITAPQMKPSSMNEDDCGNDDTIFNFNFEPEVQAAEPSSRLRPIQPATANKTPDAGDSNLSFEIAVIYICPACGAEFDAQDAWKRHMNGLHSYNTRNGLNFVQIDKLYHECLECHKRIAMHSMENLLKHKFTHLPFRCTKCRVCLRQYKYRQDLMVHLRMLHRDDVLALTSTLKQSAKTDINNGGIGGSGAGASTSSGTNSRPPNRFSIMDVKENAVDIFENKCDDGIEVRNELIDPDDNDIDDIDADADAEQSRSSFLLPSFLEDTASRDSSTGSNRADDEELCEKHIQYICPACKMEYGVQSQWRYHIENIHDYGTRKGLNFKEVNMKQNAQCLECNKILSANNIRHMQLHKFSHLPTRAWLRCKLCFRSFVGKKEIIKHLLNQHHVSRSDDIDDSQEPLHFMEDDDMDGGDDQGSQNSRPEERDIYEPNIEYLCPQCGKEFKEKKMWRKHIVKIHRLTDLQVLNFKIINDRQVVCLECNKIITNAYGVQNAQQHRITHMPFKSFIRCRLCAKSYTDRKGLVKHLRTVHRVGKGKAPPSPPTLQNYLYHQNSSQQNSYSRSSFSQSESSQPYSARASLLPRQQQMSHHSQQLKPTPPQKKSQPHKEIVQHAGYTYEIQYLDDDGGDETMDNEIMSEINMSNSFDQFSRFKCDDCASIFTTKEDLTHHIQKEHEFLDYYNLKPVSQAVKNQRANESRNFNNSFSSANTSMEQNRSIQNSRSNEIPTNDPDDLLIPTGDEEVSSLTIQDSANIERNFCYLCPACGVEFKMQNDWRRHINDVHNFDKRHFLNFRQIEKFRYQCTECGDIVCNSKLKGLQDHKFRHLSFKLYIKCLICGNCYNHKPNMINHLKTRHNIQEQSQSTAGFDNEFTNKLSTQFSTPKPTSVRNYEDSQSFHNAVDHESIVYCCPQCNASFDTHVYWRKHIVEQHKLNTRTGLNFRQIDHHHYLCLQCYKRVTVTHTKGAIGQLQSHKFRHLPYKSFKCNACLGEFVRKQMFFKHLNRNTNLCDGVRIDNGERGSAVEEIIPIMRQPDHPRSSTSPVSGVSGSLILNKKTLILLCPECGQECDDWNMWLEHTTKEHQLDQREKLNFTLISPTMYECNDCKMYVSSRIRDLQQHRYKHLRYGAYIQCRFCDCSFYKIGLLERHLRGKHPNVVVDCDDYAKFGEIRRYEDATSPIPVEFPKNEIEKDDESKADQDESDENDDNVESDDNDEGNDDNDNDDDDVDDDDDDDDNNVDDERENEEDEAAADDEQFLLG